MSAPLRIQQIRQFTIAARLHSFRAAAEETHRSQGAVSLAIQELEASVGGVLFDRGRHASLTPLGDPPLLADHDQTLRLARQLAEAQRGTISLAVAPSLSEEWLPDLMQEFHQMHSDVHLMLVDMPSRSIPGMVLAGSADIGICGLMNLDPDAELVVTPVLEDVFGVVCPKVHPLAKAGGSQPWSAIRAERQIGTATSDYLRSAGRGKDLGEEVISVSNRTVLRECLLRGLGVTVLPTLGAPRGPGLAFIPLTRPRVARRIGLVKRRGRSLLPAAAAMEALAIGSLRAFGKAHGIKVL